MRELLWSCESSSWFLQFAVYAAYRNRLETAFLADELASAIPTATDCTSRPVSPKRGQGSAISTPIIASSPRMGSPSQQEHLQITQPDGATALASRWKDRRSSAQKDEAASSAGEHFPLLHICIPMCALLIVQKYVWGSNNFLTSLVASIYTLRI